MNRAPLWLGLLVCAAAFADDPPPQKPAMLDLHTFSDSLAALQCYRKGYPYFVKISKDRYICLLGNAGVPDARPTQAEIKP